MEALEQGADRHHPGFQHGALDAVGDPRKLMDRLGHRAETLAPLADQVELVLDRPEVLAEPAELGGPSFDRARAIAVGTGVARPFPAVDPEPVEPAGDAVEPVEGVGGQGLGVRRSEQLFESSRDLEEARLVDHELAGQVHQLVEPVDIDPDRLGDPGPLGLGTGLFLLLFLFGWRLSSGGRCGGRFGDGFGDWNRGPGVEPGPDSNRISVTPSTSATECSSPRSQSVRSQTRNSGSDASVFEMLDGGFGREHRAPWRRAG